LTALRDAFQSLEKKES